MRTAQEIYEAYSIMPNLQLHQLRVAAVGKAICDAFPTDLDTRLVVLTGLFHDMGNIVKSDFSVFPDFWEPEGRAHWELVKADFVRKYGKSAHAATMTIVDEIGLDERARERIDLISFSRLEEARDNDSMEGKICEYSDLRVGPHGVLTLEARVMDAKRRYAERNTQMGRTEEEFERLFHAARHIEEQIFAMAAISPDDITEQSIQGTIEELRSYPVA